MNNIKYFKLELTNMQKINTYELDFNLKKEIITTTLGNSTKKEEKILDSVSFVDKKYIITENTKNLKNMYKNSNVLDGTTIKIEIISQNNETRTIICKNEFPKEVTEIIEMIGI